jgi:hypothetical protein
MASNIGKIPSPFSRIFDLYESLTILDELLHLLRHPTTKLLGKSDACGK